MKKNLIGFLLLVVALLLFKQVNAYQNQAGTHSPTPSSTTIQTSTTSSGSGNGNGNSTSNPTSTSCSTCTQNQNQVNTKTSTQNQGEESNLTIEVKVNLNSDERNALQEQIQAKEQELTRYLNQVQEKIKSIYQNQLSSQLAAQAFLSLGESASNTNQEMITTAQNLSAQIQSAIQNEEKLTLRNRITKFFLGADQDATDNLTSNISQIESDIANLQTELNTYDADTQYMYQQYLDNLTQELNRLQEKVQTETKSQGIFGWFLNLFR